MKQTNTIYKLSWHINTVNYGGRRPSHQNRAGSNLVTMKTDAHIMFILCYSL